MSAQDERGDRSDTGEVLRAAGITRTSYAQFHEVARAGLGRLSSLGVRWKGTRFETYRDLLLEAAARTYPRRIDWRNDRPALLEELEAIGQTIQLGCAVALRSHVDRKLLEERLRFVVGGRAIPTEDDDKPRNTLLELTTGFLLAHGGAGVDLTSAKEDLVVRLPGVPPLPVECKRPLADFTVERNVKTVRHQLEDIRDRYPLGGLAVLGLDRVAGVSGELGNVDTPADLPKAVKEVLEDGAREIVGLGGEKLERAAVGVMTVLAGAVFSIDPPLPTAVLRIAWLPLAPWNAERRRVQEALSGVFTSRPGPALEALVQ